MSADSERVDVIVLTKNSADTLEECLSAIERDVPVHHLIVADGGSTDGTLDIVAAHRCKVILDARPISRARYLAVREADTRMVAFVDSDIVIFPGWYRALARWFQLPRVAWAQGVPLSPSYTLPEYGTAKESLQRRYGLTAFADSLLLREVALMAEDWTLRPGNVAEDVQLYRLCRSKGLWVVTDPTFPAGVHLPDAFLHDLYAAYRGGRSNSGHPLAHLADPVFYAYLGIRSAAAYPSPSHAPAYFALALCNLAGLLDVRGRSLGRLISRIQGAAVGPRKAKLIGAELDFARKQPAFPFLQGPHVVSLRSGL